MGKKSFWQNCYKTLLKSKNYNNNYTLKKLILNKPYYIISISIVVGYMLAHSSMPFWDKYNVEIGGNVFVCFTPERKCTKLIIDQIDQAKESLYIQAFSFTSIPIIESILRAKDRGVKIKILLDKDNLTDPKSALNYLKKNKIFTCIDKLSGIAHNKIMIIDLNKVITGSFNFTKAADNRNAENLLLIKDKNLAERYYQNWLSRYQNCNKINYY